MKNENISVVVTAVIFCLLIICAPLHAQEKKDTKSDIWLEAQLVTAYTLNEHLNPFKIDVDVENGIANISGSVDSDIERDLAVEIARGIDGIKEVHENLVVEPSGKAEKEKSGFARKVEDATLTAKVKYRLILNKNIASYDINVDTEKGVVILSGKVDSPAKRDLAVKLAENTSGVDRVRDNLTVVDSREMGEKQSGSSMKKKMEELSQDMKDTWITAKARSLLLVSAEAEGADYDISTENGKVTVAGTVMSRQQAEDIQKILEDLQGVRKVENNLKVREQGKSV